MSFLSVSSIANWAITVIALTSSFPAASSAITVGDTYCIEGYVMDYYCIHDGFLLDNPSLATLEYPDRHSIHCLVDIDVCATSPFEILVDPISTVMENNSTSSVKMTTPTYGRGWRVTDTSREILIDLARTVGDQCYTCYDLGMQTEGFRAVMNGTVVALASGDVPPIIEIHSAFPSSDDTTMVDSADGVRRYSHRMMSANDLCLKHFNMEAVSSMDGSDTSTIDGDDDADDQADDHADDHDGETIEETTEEATTTDNGGSAAPSHFMMEKYCILMVLAWQSLLG